MNTCIQCGSDAPDRFCSTCGQKQDLSRLTFKTFLSDFASRIYGLDGAMPRTIVGLFKNPGSVVEEYVKGVRSKYVAPVGYYFLLFAVFLLLFSIYDVEFLDYANPKDFNEVLENTTGEDISTKTLERQQLFQKAIFSKLQFFTILQFPFFAFFALLFFKSTNYNFMENMVFAFYIHAQMLFLNMAGVTYFSIFGTSIKFITVVLGLIYLSISGSYFYSKRLSLSGVIKSALVYVLSYLAFFIIITIGIICYIVLTRRGI